MSLEIQNLTKLFGAQKAVDNVSFSVANNEILAFLGPNGAGKSTTMKIATCYLQPDEGTVLVNGMDVLNEQKKIRKSIGYLPEHNPLYLDMYVHEYLRFSGRFYNINRNKLRNRVGEVIKLCQLDLEQNKKIGQLSKGYRQRVGLAQALLHDPSVLILDEPTSGLDPNQIVEVRNLIKEISQSKTVLFSTHIMQEVEAMCDRVVVISQGKLVADDKVKNLSKKGGQNILEVEFSEAIDKSVFEKLEGVTNIKTTSDNVYELETASTDVRPELMKVISENQLPLVGMKMKTQSLEEVFSQLTQEAHD